LNHETLVVPASCRLDMYLITLNHETLVVRASCPLGMYLMTQRSAVSKNSKKLCSVADT